MTVGLRNQDWMQPNPNGTKRGLEGSEAPGSPTWLSGLSELRALAVMHTTTHSIFLRRLGLRKSSVNQARSQQPC